MVFIFLTWLTILKHLVMIVSLQKGQPSHLLSQTPHYWLPTHFENFITSPPNFQASKPFPNCIQIHHFNLYKTLL